MFNQLSPSKEEKCTAFSHVFFSGQIERKNQKESRTACLGIAEGGARTLDLEVWNI
jgi:hypothetical protein